MLKRQLGGYKMKNLEKLKIALIDQIEKMSASEFEELTDVL